jgi:hypothetical protein
VPTMWLNVKLSLRYAKLTTALDVDMRCQVLGYVLWTSAKEPTRSPGLYGPRIRYALI